MRKVVLVTGASRGIGAAVARLAAREGWTVAVNYHRSPEAAEKVVAEIREGSGAAVAVQADVADPDQVSRMFRAIDEKLGKVSALVNNAGILEKQCRVEDLDPGRLRRIFETNVFGAVYCAQEAIKRMSTKHGGSGGPIVNVSSVASRLGAAGEYVDYAAAKGALDTFTIGLAKEVAAEGIRVNAVRPGYIYTDIHAAGGEPDRVNRLKSSLPMGRGGRAEEVAEAILWLISDKASYATGSFIELAGGR